MKKSLKFAALYGTTLLLAACASTPMGPTVRALPPQGKPFEVFARINLLANSMRMIRFAARRIGPIRQAFLKVLAAPSLALVLGRRLAEAMVLPSVRQVAH